MDPKKTETPEQKFRSSLEDCLAVIQKLSPVCASIEEMAGMIELALENEAQNRLLMATVMGKR